MMGQKQSYLTSNIIHSVLQQKFIEHIVHICHSSRFQFRSVQSLVRVSDSLRPPWTAARQATLSITALGVYSSHVHLSR